MLWMISYKLEQDVKCIIVCPFIALLNKHYQKMMAFRLHCHKFGDKTMTVSNDI